MAGGFMSDNVREHPRDRAGLTYVYPVVSRRARGVSIGVNLNPNAHCNWRCVYCQVPGLQRGAGPEIDLELLRSELEGFLEAVTAGDWLEHFAPPEARRINDVAFSGDGESTTSPQFAECVELVAECMARFGLLERGVKLVLITNGSMVGRGEVQEGLARLAEANGEVWFKFDGAREQDRLAINDVRIPDSRVRANLRTAAALAPTRIQTCVFARSGEEPDEAWQAAYLGFLAEELAQGTPIRDVMLYGLARPSHQPEAAELRSVSDDWLRTFAGRVRALGLPVSAFGAEGPIEL
ncbi:MAG: radical SAM protein [Planctomycetota bacterium]